MKFKLNEIIIFNSQNPKLIEIQGTKGYVYGSVFDSNKQTYLYAIMGLKTEIVYSCYEDELIATDEHFSI